MNFLGRVSRRCIRSFRPGTEGWVEKAETAKKAEQHQPKFMIDMVDVET